MTSRKIQHRSASILLLIFLFSALALSAHAQSGPLTSQELVRLVYQLPAHPEKRDEIIEEIRKRGIDFQLTAGLRSVVATKSGNDVLLRRTLEEAERRRLNPTTATLPSEAEAQDLLAKARVATLAAAEAMPDFIVRQQITRSRAFRNTNNWVTLDRLTIAVSYRASAGEEYKLLAINGLPPGTEVKEGGSYEQIGGTSSTGEYVSMLAALFNEATRAEFKPVDTDTLREHRTIVYEFAVKQQFSKLSIKAAGADERAIVTGYRGRIWVDRESYRVLRLEVISTDIPADFPVTAANSRIDYDWVTINERQYLLPSYAEIKLTAGLGERSMQTRNEIRFRNYQKYGAEVKIIEDIEDFEDEKEPGKKP
ncbi:MAG: hypothetical protein QOH25_2616 [Acidobacteriota bacterium]|jgi:hypothetical protein|nr:hypothetical protein [Acidobacteriota bacterium]